MPIYEYKCENCSQIFDKLIPASRRDDKQECPECSGTGIRKMSLIARSKGGENCSSCSSHNCSSCSSGGCSSGSCSC